MKTEEIDQPKLRGHGQAGLTAAVLIRHALWRDLHATADYLAVNHHPLLGIAPDNAERAAWRAGEAHRFDIESGSVLLAIAPPECPGGWSMLINAHDARDGTGTRLLAARWLGPYEPRDPVTVFSTFVARFGVPPATGRREALFYLHTSGTMPPQPLTRPDGVELYPLPQTGVFGEPLGWAWCLGSRVGQRASGPSPAALAGRRM